MVIQAKVLWYSDFAGKDKEDTCILCIPQDVQNCFTAAMDQIENYYGNDLTGITEIKILSDNDFLALEGDNPIDEGLVRV